MAVVVVLLSLITLSLVVLLVRERMRTKSLRSRFGPIVDLSEAHARLLKEHEEAKKRMDAQRRELDQALRTERETLERQAQTVRRDLAARHEQVQRDAQTLKEQYGPVADLTLKRARLVEEQALLEDEIQTRRQRFEDALATATAELNRLTAEVASLETKADLASFGLGADPLWRHEVA